MVKMGSVGVLFVMLVGVGLALPAHLQLDEAVIQFAQAPEGQSGATEGQHWAFLCAGSIGYMNYRHQADVFHAYHLMIKNGIPKDNIIVMAFDDIAYDEMNPTPGIVVNKINGPDVYAGVKIDYNSVTPEYFLAILKGDEKMMGNKGSGRVINSGPNDHVFVNFVDHGGPGILGFADGMLHAHELVDTIQWMHDNNRYKQMVWYVEACEAGSIFYDLMPDDINVFVTTASNWTESSYACYFDKERKTYLGDVYSIKWMEDADVKNLQDETLQEQFKVVKKETNTSHVQEFGDLSIASSKVAEFLGGMDYVYRGPRRRVRRQIPPPIHPPDACLKSAVKSEDVPVAILRHRLADATDEDEMMAITKELHTVLATRKAIETTMKNVVSRSTRNEVQATRVMGKHRRIKDWDCHRAVIDDFHAKCFNLNQYEFALRRLYMLVNLCEEGVGTQTIQTAMHRVCTVDRHNVPLL